MIIPENICIQSIQNGLSTLYLYINIVTHTHICIHTYVFIYKEIRIKSMHSHSHRAMFIAKIRKFVLVVKEKARPCKHGIREDTESTYSAFLLEMCVWEWRE